MESQDKAHILIVDDSQTIRNSIARYLGETYTVHHASNGNEAWKLIQSGQTISLVFADLNMPVMNGMELLKKIRSAKDKHISELPVIMITGHEDTEAAKRASYTLGASEFISKPFCEFDIISRVETCISLKQKIDVLEQNSIHDELTGLYNARGFNQLADQSLAASNRHEYDLSILSLKIANIDSIFDKYGSKIVSQVIIAVAKTLSKSLRKEESLAHLGNGQFAMLMPLTKVFRAQIVAQRFYKSITSLVFKIKQDELRIKLALGFNSTQEYASSVSFNEIMTDTESAMQQSLTSQPPKMVRYDATLQKMFASTITTTGETLHTEHATDKFQMKNTVAFSEYMSMILNGQFSKIPKDDRQILVEPMQAFLSYVEEEKLAEEAG